MLKKLREEFLENKFQTLIVDREGTIVACDNRIFSLTEGSNITDFHPFFYALSSLFESDKLSQKFFCVQMEVIGKLSFFDISTKVDRENNQVFIQMEDLSDHYKNVHQIKQVRNESIIQFNIAQELNNELEIQRGFKNKFLANVSHEIRTPLNSILGFLNVLENTGLSREQLDLIHILKNSSDNLVSIVDDLLDISKIEAGKLEIKNKRFDFISFLNELGNTYKLRSDEKRLDFTLEIGEKIPRFLIGDKLRLNQIFVNLLENALKYTHSGSITFRVDTKSRNARRIPVTFEVSDTGIGIAEENLENIFQSFSQIEKRGLFGGAGLGLSIVKQLADLMGTFVEVESVESQGSTFKLTISLGVSHDQKTGKTSRKEKNGASKLEKGKKYRILLAEDVEINQLLLMKLFSAHKEYSLDIAKNGEKALELLNRYPYDLVLMDLTMPTLDGFDTTARIRSSENKKLRKIPVIALTARISEEEEEATKEAGMNAYLTKPIDEDILFKTINKHLTKYKRSVTA